MGRSQSVEIFFEASAGICRRKKRKKAMGVIAFTTGLYILAYLASIMASMTMFDATTKFENFASSACVCGLLILLVYLGVWLRNKNRGVVIVLTVIILGFAVSSNPSRWITGIRAGLGTHPSSGTNIGDNGVLRELPKDVMIYTNEPATVYLCTGRGNYVLPDQFDSATAQVRPGFEEGIERMQRDINNGNAVLALFDGGEVFNGRRGFV